MGGGVNRRGGIYLCVWVFCIQYVQSCPLTFLWGAGLGKAVDCLPLFLVWILFGDIVRLNILGTSVNVVVCWTKWYVATHHVYRIDFSLYSWGNISGRSWLLLVTRKNPSERLLSVSRLYHRTENMFFPNNILRVVLLVEKSFFLCNWGQSFVHWNAEIKIPNV